MVANKRIRVAPLMGDRHDEVDDPSPVDQPLTMLEDYVPWSHAVSFLLYIYIYRKRKQEIITCTHTPEASEDSDAQQEGEVAADGWELIFKAGIQRFQHEDLQQRTRAADRIVEDSGQ